MRLLLMLICLSLAGQDMVVRRMARKAAPNALYFGWPSDGSDPTGGSEVSGLSGYRIAELMQPYASRWTAPKTGAITAIEAWVKIASGTEYIRMAVYDATTSTPPLICQYTAGVAVTNSSFAWIGSSATLTGACTVTSGSIYYVSISYQGSGITSYRLLGQPSGTATSDAGHTYVADGMPSNLPGLTGSTTALYALRAKVE